MKTTLAIVGTGIVLTLGAFLLLPELEGHERTIVVLMAFALAALIVGLVRLVIAWISRGN